ncbi:MAG: glutaredoxin family protein [Rhodocyclales bacterium]|nr:glutaredoxin family protein [Rhodocyclales bacterium]
MPGPRLRLYSRNYCHLCHDMLVALQALRGEPGVADFEIEVLDVDADPEMEAKYDELVPVLADEEGQELCHYFLDAPKVLGYLDRFPVK